MFNRKILKGIITLIVITIFILLAFGSNGDNKPLSESEKKFLAQTESELREEFKNKNFTKDFKYPKKTYTITIPRGATLGNLGNSAYQDLQIFENNFNMGGRKICYEISADLSGFKNSNDIVAKKQIKFYSIGALGFKIHDLTDQSDNLPSRIFNGHISFLNGEVQ